MQDKYDELNAEMRSTSDAAQKLNVFVWLLALTSFTFVFGPILFIAKILQILFPWIIIGYLVYNDLLFTNKIDTFQLVMLSVHIGLQLIVFCLGIKVCRIHWWLFHIDPGMPNANWGRIDINGLQKRINEFYH